MDTIETENTLGISFCERQPLAFTHGRGSRVWDEAGREYLDFSSGWGVTCLGHSHPVLLQALNSQAARIMQNPNAGFSYAPTRAKLLQTLRSVLPEGLSHSYFCNSGAEANDAALKLARRITGRRRVVSTRGSFHGRSLATLSVSRGPENPQRFPASSPDTLFIPYGETALLDSAVDARTAAVIVEPVQGEGGVQIPPDLWLQQVQQQCRANGALLIVDEIQTGFCRTGSFFAHQQSPEPVRPDLMTMAKGIAGGFPFAAFAVTAEVHARLSLDDHGGTYCGNPLGCAVADAVVSYLRDNNIAAEVRRKGQRLGEMLETLRQRHPSWIESIRARGLLCALQLRNQEQVRALSAACADAGLLVVPTRNAVVRLLPDLLVSDDDLAQGFEILDSVLGNAA